VEEEKKGQIGVKGLWWAKKFKPPKTPNCSTNESKEDHGRVGKRTG